jgi:rhomboid protease GluP
MAWSWGYSPKTENYIPLDGFPAERYLVIALHAIKNLGWSLSHVSESGIIAYTGLSWQSYSEEISIRTISGFGVVKSECVGIQMLFNDYGKNDDNLKKFFDEFEYVEYQLQDSWEEELILYYTEAVLQDDNYFEKAPLASKAKINNVFNLFTPSKDYFATPILVQLNVLYYILTTAVLHFSFRPSGSNNTALDSWSSIYHHLGVNNRYLTLSGGYWRLISSQFVHFSLGHVFFNMYALIYIGLMVENKTGSMRFMVIYLLAGITGGAISILFHPAGNIAGASGAIMGMFGCFFALLINGDFEKNARKALLISTLLVVTIILISGLQRGIDNSAHVVGLISGFVFTWVFQWSIAKPHLKPVWSYAIVVLLATTITGAILALTPNYQLEKFNELSYSYHRNEFQAWRIYYYNNYFPNGTKEEKLRRITHYGISNWQKNVAISKEMQALILPETHKQKADRMSKFSETLLKINQLLYYECAEGTDKYRPEIERLTNQMNAIKKRDYEF